MRRVAQTVLALLCLVLLLTADVQGWQKSSAVSKKADPAGTGPTMGLLRSLFTDWDVNKDNYLDKRELARGFRMLQAKAAPPEKEPPPAIGTDKTKTAPGQKAASTLEQQFLAQVDQDGDKRVSRDEFINWAREYAVLLKNIATAEGKIAKAEAKLKTNLRETTRKTVEADLQAERKALEKLVGQLPPFDKMLQVALKPAEKH